MYLDKHFDLHFSISLINYCSLKETQICEEVSKKILSKHLTWRVEEGGGGGLISRIDIPMCITRVFFYGFRFFNAGILGKVVPKISERY